MADALGVLTLQPNNAETCVEPTGHHAPFQDDPVSWDELEEAVRGAVSQHHYTGPAGDLLQGPTGEPRAGERIPLDTDAPSQFSASAGNGRPRTSRTNLNPPALEAVSWSYAYCTNSDGEGPFDSYSSGD